MDTIKKGSILNQVYTVSKEEGFRIIEKAKIDFNDQDFINKLIEINNNK